MTEAALRRGNPAVGAPLRHQPGVVPLVKSWLLAMAIHPTWLFVRYVGKAGSFN